MMNADFEKREKKNMERTKKRTKKLFAVLLIFAMAVPCIPTTMQTVKAADRPETVEKENGEKYIWYEDISIYRTKEVAEHVF